VPAVPEDAVALRSLLASRERTSSFSRERIGRTARGDTLPPGIENDRPTRSQTP